MACYRGSFKCYKGMREWMYRSMFISALVTGKWSASLPTRFTPGKEPPTPRHPLIGGKVGRRAGLDDMGLEP